LHCTSRLSWIGNSRDRRKGEDAPTGGNVQWNVKELIDRSYAARLEYWAMITRSTGELTNRLTAGVESVHPVEANAAGKQSVYRCRPRRPRFPAAVVTTNHTIAEWCTRAESFTSVTVSIDTVSTVVRIMDDTSR
jgi:hypothetical protein